MHNYLHFRVLGRLLSGVTSNSVASGGGWASVTSGPIQVNLPTTTMTAAPSPASDQSASPIQVTVVTACDQQGVVDFQDGAGGMRNQLLSSLTAPSGSSNNGNAIGAASSAGSSATITINSVTDTTTGAGPAALAALLSPPGSDMANATENGAADASSLFTTNNPLVMQDSYYIYESGDKPVFVKFAKYNIVVEVRPSQSMKPSPWTCLKNQPDKFSKYFFVVGLWTFPALYSCEYLELVFFRSLWTVRGSHFCKVNICVCPNYKTWQ